MQNPENVSHSMILATNFALGRHPGWDFLTASTTDVEIELDDSCHIGK